VTVWSRRGRRAKRGRDYDETAITNASSTNSGRLWSRSRR